MPAHSRSKNGVASLAYVAGIHVLKCELNQRRGWPEQVRTAQPAPAGCSDRAAGLARACAHVWVTNMVDARFSRSAFDVYGAKTASISSAKAVVSPADCSLNSYTVCFQMPIEIIGEAFARGCRGDQDVGVRGDSERAKATTIAIFRF